MSFGGSFFGAPRSKLKNLEVDVATLVADAVNDRIGVGDSAPGTQLQIKGEQPYVTLQNSTAENSDGGCEAKIIFEDHANVSLGQIEVNHSGSADDTKGKMVLSTHTGSSLTAALTIDEAQQVIVADSKLVLGSTAVTATAAELNLLDGVSGLVQADLTKLAAVDASAAEINAVADASGRTAAAIAVADDHFMFLDGGATGDVKVESIADLATAMAGTGISASSGVLNLDSITTVGAVNSGSITSGFGSIDNGSSAITTTGNISGGDITASGGDVNFGNGQNANVAVAAVSGTNTTGKSLTLKAGPGTGSGAGGDIIFQTANAGGSGSSANSLATALTISDDLSATFAGEAIIGDGNLKLGSTAVAATAAEINAVCDNGGRTEEAVNVAQDYMYFLDGNHNGDAKVDSIADVVSAIASTGLDAASGQLSVDVSDFMANGVNNRVVTATGADAMNAESKLLCDGATTTIGDGTAEDAMLAFDGNAQDFRIGLDDGTDVLEIGHGTTMGTNTAISVNSSGQVTAFNIPAAAVAQASDHIIFLDGGATGAPKAESIDDFLTAIAGSGISVSSSQLTASGGAIDLNGLSAAVVDVAADSIAIIDANDSNASRKESIADFCSAIAGTAVSSSNGVLNVDVGAAATGLANNDSLPGGAASSADQIIAIQVFS